MKYKHLKYYFSEWKKLNSDFIIKIYRNYKYPKRTDITFNDNFKEIFFLQARPVFVLSTGRCGTKFLTTVFNRIPSVDIYHSPMPELIFFVNFAYKYYKTKSSELLNIVSAARSELILDSFLRRRVYIETNNMITFFAYALAELFPKSKFIHLVRHPGSFVRSGILRKWYHDNNIYDIGKIRPHHSNVIFNSLSDIEKIGWLWNETNQFIEDFKISIGDNNRIITIKAEEMFSRKESLGKIFSFLNINAEDKFLKKQIRKKPVNVQKLGTYPKFNDWNEEKKTLLRNVAILAKQYKYSI